MKTILLDVDGLIADFFAATCASAATLGVPYRVEDCTDYDAVFNLAGDRKAELLALLRAPGWCRQIPAYPGAESFVAALEDLGNVEVVTTPFDSSTWHAERLAWLRGNALFLPGKRVTFTHEKALIRGDVLIDDRYDTIVRWALVNPDALAILFDRPWNQSAEPLPPNAVRCRTYAEVLAVIS